MMIAIFFIVSSSCDAIECHTQKQRNKWESKLDAGTMEMSEATFSVAAQDRAISCMSKIAAT